MKLKKMAVIGAVVLVLTGIAAAVVVLKDSTITKDNKSGFIQIKKVKSDRTHDVAGVSGSVVCDNSDSQGDDTDTDTDYKNERSIACWGDSMTEGMGSDEGYILTDTGKVDISYYTSPFTIEKLTGYKTYNFGVSGEKSDEIARRAGGLEVYTDRDLYITRFQYTDVVLVDENGKPIHMCDYSGYGIEYNEYPDTVYINGVLCQIENRYEEKEAKLRQIIDGAGNDYGDWFDNMPGFEEDMLSDDYDNLRPEDYVVGIRICDDTDEDQPDVMYVAKGSRAIPKAAQDHKDDILILEMGSNGGWDNYDQLIAQYQAIIDYTGCEDYIIVGDTDDPGTSIADDGNLNMDADDSAGNNYTEWEAALEAAFGEHFFNARLYLVENGLDICGLRESELDRQYSELGCISGKLRSDWTHFNAYGYFAQGIGIYQKGVELGYWE